MKIRIFAFAWLTFVHTTNSHSAVVLDYVTVGNPGNASDPATGFGAVDYVYAIGKYEVTNAQYTEFLNAKAKSDPLALYHPNMSNSAFQGGILRSGSSGSFIYTTTAGLANRPVHQVDFFDAMRFTNWLHNGQGNGGTETGAYTLSLGGLAPRNPEARVWVPSENEWYKAAYYQPASQGGDTDNYWLYPTRSNSTPARIGPNDTNPNSANFGNAVDLITDVGSYKLASSFYGTFDQGGNLHEFTDTVVGSGRVRRGGGWGHGEILMEATLRESEAPIVNGNLIGFRVAAAPTAVTTIAQQAYLKASNTGAGDAFGWSVAVSGDTVVVGTPSEDSSAAGVNGNQSDNSASGSGAAYVFVRNGTTWIQQAYLKASNPGGGDQFGGSVGISGDTVIVGALVEASSATGINGNQSNNNATNSGAAYVFVRNGTEWSQQAYLKASNTGGVSNITQGDLFGSSVSVSGDTVVVGAYQEASNATGVNGNQSNNNAASSGAAYVFVRNGTTWSQQAYLKASNTGAGDNFGFSVSASGDTVVVGSYREASNATGVNGNQSDNSASNSGAAYIFVRSGTAWSQQAYLKASNTGVEDYFGSSVEVSGNTVAIGAFGEDSNSTGVNGNQSDNTVEAAGAAYVFVRNGATWSQQAYLKASNPEAFDIFGSSVAVSGDTVAVAAYGEDSGATGVNGNQSDNSASSSGAAYVFVRGGTTWSQQAYLKASNTGAGDLFGRSVALFGDTVIVGAREEDSSATGVDGSQSDNSASNAGAVYVFTGVGPVLTAIESWRQTHFGSRVNSGDGADLVDPDGDGLVNLLEFSTAQDPRIPNRAANPFLINGQTLEFMYIRNKAATTEVVFAVEWSDTLAVGSWGTAGIAESVVSDDGTVQQVKATFPAGSSGQRFVRLRVSR